MDDEENETHDDHIIRFKSKDQKTFEVSNKAASIAELVRDVPKEDGDVTEIEIDRVNSGCLEKVVAFMEHYNTEPMVEIPTPLGGSTFNEVMKQTWYQDFVKDENLSQDDLFGILQASNYLGIKPLLDLACLKVTFQLTGKDAEQIRQILRLPELTPEEEAKARQDHKWIFDTNEN